MQNKVKEKLSHCFEYSKTDDQRTLHYLVLITICIHCIIACIIVLLIQKTIDNVEVQHVSHVLSMNDDRIIR